VVRTGLPGSVTGPLRARPLAGGRANLTYEVSDGTGSWVVRRLPLGHVLATAHDMGREYRVITTGSLDAPGSGRCRRWHPPLPDGAPLSAGAVWRGAQVAEVELGHLVAEVLAGYEVDHGVLAGEEPAEGGLVGGGLEAAEGPGDAGVPVGGDGQVLVAGRCCVKRLLSSVGALSGCSGQIASASSSKITRSLPRSGTSVAMS